MTDLIEYVEKETEVEKILRYEQIEQKKALSGVRGRASRTGRKGAVQFPYEWLDTKNKKSYTKAGEVVVYSMYDEILSYQEFSRLSNEQKANALRKWRKTKTTQDIIDKFQMPRAKFYTMMKELGVETIRQDKKAISYTDKTPKPEKKPQKSDSLTIGLGGEFSGKRLAEKLIKLASIIETEESTFSIDLEIVEVRESL